ncbi:DDE-type integrase/transposase/recombinase [Candidatus Micrarchaeota archaeon]|nr:DDE-type integrase/transposase/recombinase [Candidatus Micrarchaeota archaeon]
MEPERDLPPKPNVSQVLAAEKQAKNQEKTEEKCEYCNSKNTMRYGCRKIKNGVRQTYFCNVCKRKFSVGGCFKRHKLTREMVAEICDLYFRNFSLRAISAHFRDFRDMRISPVTVLGIIRKAVGKIKSFTDTLVPEVGTVWGIDETMYLCRDLESRYAWNYNAIDLDTRFLLSQQFALTRSEEDTVAFLSKAKHYAGSGPVLILSDSMNVYPKAISRVFKFDRPRHVKSNGLEGKSNNNKIERYHGSLKDRLKPMRGFGRFRTSAFLLHGSGIYYNFVRTHLAIGKTPAEAAKIQLPEGKNKWLALLELADSPVCADLKPESAV